MRTIFAALAAASLLGLVAFGGRVEAAGALTGKMEMFNYLIGTWSCSTNMSAMGKQPAEKGQSTVAFDIVPGNVFHDHVSAAHYADDDYYGYSAKSATYWDTSADNTGGHAYATSQDGETYTGSSWQGSSSMHVVSVYKKVSPTKVTVHEVITDSNGQKGTFDATCTK